MKTHLPCVIAIMIAILTPTPSFAACTNNSDISINIVTAYNFIVDNNVETPAGTPLKSAYVGAEFCNTTADTLVNVTFNIGEHTGGGNGTPGIYPSEASWPGLTGSFELTHVADVSDASRFITQLLPGECIFQYWLIEYPILDDAGNATYVHCPDETDDLKLNYDIWATFSDDETPSSSCYSNDSRSATMRCEITASANKIWPNGDNKVPAEYVEAIEAEGYTLGWGIEQSLEVANHSQVYGIWFDLGNVNQGFDNNGDFIPDYNAWIQPVGNPDLFDPNCFRLVGVHGFLIAKTNTVGDVVIPFKNEMYFENIPPSNTGVVGLTYYEFVATNEGCTASLTPYQEVASGRNNEKFNADFGKSTPIQSGESEISIDKTVDSLIIGFPPNPNTLTYTLTVDNSGTTVGGAPEIGLPLVISDKIPANTSYKTGTMSTTSGSYTLTPVYSTDGGSTWQITEPTPVSSITNIQWWMNEALQAGESVTVTFQLSIDNTYADPTILNTAGVGVGNADPFDEDDAITFVKGDNSIGDTVFVDNGNGSGGIYGNGIPDGTEAGIPGVTLYAYYDIDGNGIVGPSDFLFDSLDTDANGYYLFQNLTDGDYIIVIDKMDVINNPSYPGHNLTTNAQYTVSVSGGSSFLGADFGFAPPLSIDKSISTATPIHEGQEITYPIDVTNNLGGAVGNWGAIKLFFPYYGTVTYSSNPDGSNVTEIIATSPPAAEKIAIDEVNGKIYYNTFNDIYVTDLDGSNLQTIYSTTGLVFIDIDPYNNHIYYSESNTGNVHRINTDGTNYTAITSSLTAAFGIDLDIENEKIYIGSFASDIYSVDFDGSNLTLIGTTPASSCRDIELDLDGGFVYVAALGSGIYKVNIATGAATQVYSASLGGVLSIGLDPNSNTLYFSAQNNLYNVVRGSMDGSASLETIHSASPNTGVTHDIDVLMGDLGNRFNPSYTMYDVGLEDNYNTSELEFISASISPDSVSGTGVLSWNDIGPINAGETVTIDVTFKVKYGNAGQTINNKAEITTSSFYDGNPGNIASDSVDFILNPAASIAGIVWSDIATGSAGWTGAIGYESGTDTPIPNTTVNLMVCAWEGNLSQVISSTDPDLNGSKDCSGQKKGSGPSTQNGQWVQSQSTTTGDDGAYIFNTILEEGFYYVEVDATTLPASSTQSAEANDD